MPLPNNQTLLNAAKDGDKPGNAESRQEHMKRIDISKATELIEKGEWTALLKYLPEGSHVFQFPTVGAINSCKAVGYAMNSDRLSENTVTFNADKFQRILRINISRRNG